jgi:type IV secretion system protein VirD4
MQIIEQLLKLIIELIETGFKFLFEFLEMLYTGIPKKKKAYDAEFASVRTILSRKEYGFCLTGNRNLSLKDSYQNALVIGGTGTGKSSVVLLPSLYTMKASYIINDPSSELYTKSSAFLKASGYKVKLLNPAKPQISCGFNPLERANSSSEIQKIATMLVENALGVKGKDPFWSTQAVALIAMLISILKKQESKFQNLFNVRQLLNMIGGNPEEIDAIFSRHADEVLFAEYKSFLSYDEKVVNGVVATCKAALQIFSDESVATVTAFDNLNMQEFRDEKVVLFIQNSVSDQRYYSVLTSILFEQFFSFILSRFPNEHEQDIFLLADEASSLNLPTLPLAVANVRKHRAGIMILLQDYNQLLHHYGKFDADAIRSNCFAKMYFTGGSLETTKELEATLGKFEFKDEKGNRMVRPLMTLDEIRTIKKDRALLVCGNLPPILARLRPYYKTKLFQNYSQISPVITMSDFRFEDIPILTANEHVTGE